MLLRQLVEECAKQQQSVIHLDSQRRMVTSSSINPQHCPALDVVLPASERVFGTCTDAALYVIHVGGRLIPLAPDVEAYDNYCGAQTARLFLDTIHPQMISKHKRVLHMQLVKPSALKPQDAPLHARMQAFLCKTRHCTSLMQQHVVKHGYWASVWHMGLGSSDATVGTSGDVISAVQASLSPGNPQGFALHALSLPPAAAAAKRAAAAAAYKADQAAFVRRAAQLRAHLQARSAEAAGTAAASPAAEAAAASLARAAGGGAAAAAAGADSSRAQAALGRKVGPVQ
ncbi:hypothetical protein OEZ85_005621 [Tetradesmus obliquus]|uniref:Uncharacterized protein n=1 Tax=Tetradesmus obliquus TaxID=3088 RepID=A0ABY8UDX1_TETOB|nr:hypothetical protein OEZ85_005621 [Tetradesmus obliquus]